MGVTSVIPFFLQIALPYSFLWGGICLSITGIVLTLALLKLAFATHAGRIFYIAFFMLFIPTSVLAIFLPTVLATPYTPFIQGTLNLPLLALWPLAKLEALPEAWEATAQELGANQGACVRLILWPLLKKPLVFSFFLSFFLGIAQ
ncbi:spermidine/putrescine ABC transporter permease [Acetobacter aceti 1023]|nr:spermidine/putrescine ABC transporter permease [Acetobacter aceti 1023]